MYLCYEVKPINKVMSKGFDFLKTKEGKEILKHLSVKNVKTNVGHDLTGYYCDFYLKGHGKIGYANDDGWGGEVEIKFENNKKENLLKDFLLENNVSQLMFNYGWNFIKNVDDINFWLQMEFIIGKLIDNKENEKHLKKIKQLTTKGFVYGDDNQYTVVKYKLPLKEIVEKFNGKKILQTKYNDIKSKLKKDEKFFNENLVDLGIEI